MEAPPILRVDAVTKRFGGLTAVDRVSFEVAPGRVFALIGPNGAGKTTLFNCITGLYPPSEGSVLLEGRDIAGIKPHETARLGISRKTAANHVEHIYAKIGVSNRARASLFAAQHGLIADDGR